MYSNPATPFVYQFLGNVNVFDNRLHGNWAEVERQEADEAKARAFVRPHDIDISHAELPGSLAATVAHVHPIGPVVRVELSHGGEVVEVELSRERHQALGLHSGQSVWFKPRQLKVFDGAGAPMPEAVAQKQAFYF